MGEVMIIAPKIAMAYGDVNTVKKSDGGGCGVEQRGGHVAFLLVSVVSVK